MSFFHTITYTARSDENGAPIVTISLQRFSTLADALGYIDLTNCEDCSKHVSQITIETFEFLDYRHNSMTWTQTRESYLSQTGQVDFDHYQNELRAL